MEEELLAIFDSDGVKVNSWPPHHQFKTDMAEKYQPGLVIPPLAESYHLVANGMINVLLKAGFDKEIAEVIIREEYSHFADNYPCPLFPGVSETVKMLSLYMNLALVSSNEAANVRKVLGPALTPYYKPFVTMENFPQGGKAAGIRHCLEFHGLTPDKAVYVGDTMSDKKAADEVGVFFIAAGYGWQIRPEGDHPFPVAKSFPEVGGIILSHFGLA